MTFAKNIVFRIGGIGLRLSFDEDWEFVPLGRFPDFISHSSPIVDYQVKLNTCHKQPDGSLIFDSGQAWRLYGDGDRRILWIVGRDSNPRMVGNFARDFLSGEIFVKQSEIEAGKYVFPLSYPLGELQMINLLGNGYGMMVHSCAVIDGEVGIVFAGKSTAGKTTTARLWNENRGIRILNDDRTILRKIDGQFRVFGSPWHGQGGYALAEDAPLKEIFIIKHAPINKAVRLPPSQAAAALLVRTFTPLWDAPAMDFTLQFLNDLCTTIPCYELGFVPDQSSVEYVRCMT